MDIGNLPDGGVVLDSDQFVVSRGGTARRIQGVRLVRTDISGNALLSGDPIITAGKKLRIGNTPALGGDGGDTTFLYTGDDALVVRNAADSATLFRLSSTGAGAVTGTLNVTGALTQANNQVWHAGNLTPAAYAALSGATFSGNVFSPAFITSAGSVGSLAILGGSASFAAAVVYRDTFGSEIARVGGQQIGTALNISSAAGISFGNQVGVAGALSANGAITQAGNQVWHAGNFAPGNYAALSGAAFTGNVTGAGTFDGGFIRSRGNTAPATGAGLELNFDGATGTLLSYDRSAGAYRTLSLAGSNIQINPQGGVVSMGSAVNVTGALTQAGNQVWHAGNFAPGNYAALSGATFQGNVFSPAFITSAGSIGSIVIASGSANAAGSIAFRDSSGSQIALIGGQTIGNPLNVICPSGIAFGGTVGVSGALNATGAITQAGNQVWHAGNLNPGSYAPLASPALTGTPTAPTAGAGTNNTQLATTAFVQSAVSGGGTGYALLSGANFTGALQQGGNNVYHSGNLNPALYAPLAGANFSGTVTAPNLSATSGTLSSYPSGAVNSVGAATQLVIGESSKNSAYSLNIGYWLSAGQWRGTINAIANSVAAPLDIQFSGGASIFGGPIKRDTNHYLDNSGNVALHVFDAGDYIQYDRTNNKFGFIIGGTLVASIDSGGTLRVAGNVIGATAP